MKKELKFKVPKCMKTQDIDGFTDRAGLYYGVNCTGIWNKTRSVDRFIERFAKTVQHEQVHGVITQLIGKSKRTDYGEEVVVRKLCREQFPKASKKEYK